MTDLSNIPSETDPETDFETGPESDPESANYDTAVMLWTAENLIRKLRAAEFYPGHDGRRLLTFMACRTRNVARDFLEMEFYNLRTFLKDKMLRCHRWRKAVLRALGGERALVRWEDRKALAQQRRDNPSLWPDTDEQDMRDIYIPPLRSLEAPDSAGEPESSPEIAIFRLARIKAGRNPNVRYMPLMALRTSGARESVVFPRIEVTAQELRQGVRDMEDAETAVQDDDAPHAPFIDLDIKAYIDRAVQTITD